MKAFAGRDWILMYHGTPRRDAARLERQLRMVALFFDVVPLAALTEAPGRRRRVALTFDDGLRSNIEVAYPILRALGLPATFFVCPGLVERADWLWNHEARRRLYALRGEALAELAAALGAPAEVPGFVRWMKTLPLARRRAAEAAVREATPDWRPSAAEREDYDLAGWDELKRLDRRVVTIGSHTLTHPILTSLTRDELEAELIGSRAALEAELDRPVADFCYPNGDLDETVVGMVRRHYGRAVKAEGGSLRGDIDPYRLPRLGAQPDRSVNLARALAFA